MSRKSGRPKALISSPIVEEKNGREKHAAYMLLKECSSGEITETTLTYVDAKFDRRTLDLPITSCRLPDWIVLAPVQSFNSGKDILFRYKKRDLEEIPGVRNLSKRSANEVARLVSNSFDFIHKSGYLVLNFDPSMVVSENKTYGSLRLMLPALTKISKPSALVLAGMQTYVAPEVVSNQVDVVGAHSDIFSIGVYVLSKAIDKSSFRSYEDVELYSKRCRTINPDISPYMAELLVRSTLVNDITMRPCSVTEFQKDLQAVELDECADHLGTWRHRNMKIDCGADSVTGRNKRRQINEDSHFFASETDKTICVLAVADGVSTADLGNGKIASEIMIRTLEQIWGDNSSKISGQGPQTVDKCGRELLGDIVKYSNIRIASESALVMEEEAVTQFKHPMTTTFCGVIYGNGRAVVISIGDSRIYLIRDKRIIQLTQDNDRTADYVKEKLTWDEIRGRDDYKSLTRVVGRISSDGAPLEVPNYVLNSYGLSMKPNDIIVLCSDGLYNYSVGETEYQRERSIYSICRSNTSSDAIAKTLVQAANENHGGDNITAIVMQCKEDM